MQGKLLLFCGPSGSGKTTIVRHLLDTDPRLAFSISATTRPKRETETDGVDYHFISVNEFKRRIDAGEFVEWEEVYKDRFYGTLRSEVDRLWRENKVVVFDVDVEGGLQLKKTFGELLLAVFVMPPSVEALHQRLTARQ
ncbi:MAG TPA: guanylate kinase, partial [Bacteroidia bacterium]|nr:guanylate kinase [Bacteroidia bacterium]